MTSKFKIGDEVVIHQKNHAIVIGFHTKVFDKDEAGDPYADVIYECQLGVGGRKKIQIKEEKDLVSLNQYLSNLIVDLHASGRNRNIICDEKDQVNTSLEDLMGEGYGEFPQGKEIYDYMCSRLDEHYKVREEFLSGSNTSI